MRTINKISFILLLNFLAVGAWAQTPDTTQNNPNPLAYTFSTIFKAIRIQAMGKGAKLTVSDKTDGRGGPFEVVDTTEGFHPDGGIIINVPGTKWAIARDISQSIGIKPEWWGATGDGITDDSIPIQKAYNYLSRTGGGTLLLTKSYNSPLHIKDTNITVNGGGTIRNNQIYVEGATPFLYLNCNINNIKIIYDTLLVGESLYGRDGIQLKNARNVNIDHVSFKNVNHALFIPGTDVTQQVNRIGFTNNNINVANYMLYVDSGASARNYEVGDILIDNNFAYGGIKYEHIRAYGVDGALIQNNHFFFAPDDSKQCNVNIYYCNFIKLLNNQYFEAGTEAIKIGRFMNLTITGGSIAYPGENVVSAAIRLYDGQLFGTAGANNISTIGDLTIESSSGDGIRLESMGGIGISNVLHSDLGSPAHYRHDAADVLNAKHYTVFADTLCKNVRYDGLVLRSYNKDYTFSLNGISCVGRELDAFDNVEREYVGQTVKVQDYPIRQSYNVDYTYNLLANSENFLLWGKQSDSVAVETTKAAHDLKSPLFKVYDTTNNAQHVIVGNTVAKSIGAKDYNFSFYVRYGSGIPRLDVRIGTSDLSSSGSAGFDIQHGTLLKKLDNVGQAVLKDAQIIAERDSFYRISLTVTMPDSVFLIQPFIYSSVDLRFSTTGSPYQGNNNYYYIANAQITQSTTALRYVPTSTVRKFYWDNATTLSQPFTVKTTPNEADSVVMRKGGNTNVYEVASKEALLYGKGLQNATFFENRMTVTDVSAWQKQNVSTATDSTYTPDSTALAYKIIENTVDTNHVIFSLGITKEAVDAYYTFSVLAKYAGRKVVSIRLGDAAFSIGRYGANVDLSTGDVLYDGSTGGVTDGHVSVIKDIGGWYRINMTAKIPSTITSLNVAVYMITTNTTTTLGSRYVGDGTSGIYAANPMLSQSAFPLPFITTSSRKKVNWDWLINARAYTTGAVDSLRRTGLNWEMYKNGVWTAVGTDSIGAGGSADYVPLAGTSALTGSIIPATDNVISLGAAAKKYQTIYSSAVSLNSAIGNGELKVSSGTTASAIRFFLNSTGTDVGRFAATTGNFLVGTQTDAASAIGNFSSTTKGFLIPRMTTTQRDAITAPATGLTLYNTTTNTNDFYNGTAWANNGISTVTVTTATYTVPNVTGNELIVLVNYTGGTCTVTMPSASANANKKVTIKSISANGVTISGVFASDANTIGASSYNAYTYTSEGTTFYMTGRN